MHIDKYENWVYNTYKVDRMTLEAKKYDDISVKSPNSFLLAEKHLDFMTHKNVFCVVR